MVKTFKTLHPRTNRLVIASGVIGNMIENFDVMICAFLAQFIAITFFPSNSLENNIFNTFAVFLIGYLSRPLGSLFIGLYADQVGRKKMLIFSIIMVGLCTAIIGIIPSYNSIGIMSTVLFSLFRILQNISVGGEYISSIAYLIESASKNDRGFYGSWASVGFNAGSLMASLLIFLLMYLIENSLIPAWSWRIVFILSIVGTAVGVWIRHYLPESLGFIIENSNTQISTKTTIFKSAINLIKQHPLRCLAIISVGWLGVSQTAAIFVYSPVHMTLINSFSSQQALAMNAISLLFLIPLIPLFGYLSDIYNKIIMLSFASFGFLILVFPYFWYLSYGSYLQILTLKLLFCIPSACFYSIAPVLITESFPIKFRCTSLALIYQITASLAAGLTPLILLYITNHTTNAYYSPAYFLSFSILFCLAGLKLLSKEKSMQLV